MARNGGRFRRSKKPENKNVLKTRTPNNSRNSRYSNSPRNSRFSANSRNSRGSIWSRTPNTIKKPRSPKQILLMVIILIAFICGLALGISMIVGFGESDLPNDGEVQYMNVTNNITAYENSSYDLQDENGTQISYYDFDENVTEGQNITAFNVSSSANIYWFLRISLLSYFIFILFVLHIGIFLIIW